MDDMVSKREICTLLDVVIHNANKKADKQMSMEMFIKFLVILKEKINGMGVTDCD